MSNRWFPRIHGRRHWKDGKSPYDREKTSIRIGWVIFYIYHVLILTIIVFYDTIRSAF
jgi:hypothetical protein